MTDAEFDRLLRQALMKATWDEYAPCIKEAQGRDIVFSEKYLRRREKMLQDPFGYAKKLSRTAWQRFSHAAAMILLTVSILFAAAMTIPSVRAAVVNMITDWYENRIEIHFNDSDSQIAYTTEEFSRLTPTYLPVGYEETARESFGSGSRVIFRDPDGNIIELEYRPASEGGVWALDNEHCSISSYTEGSTTYQLFAAEKDPWGDSVIWEDTESGTAFWLSSKRGSIDELFLIAKSPITIK